MQYRPKRDNKNAFVASGAFIAAAVIILVTMAMKMGYTLVNQIVLFICLTAAVYIIIRYVLADFVYHLTDDGYLEVLKITSRIPQTLASVKISADDIIIRETKTMKKAYKKEIKRRERFNLSIYAREVYWYIFTVNGIKSAIILECDGDFAAFLQSKIDSIKALDNDSLR